MTTIDDSRPVSVPSPATGGNLMPTLSGRYSHDTAIFESEQDRIFERMWFCAVRSADLPSPAPSARFGRPGERAGGAWRDGALDAFLNICRHRGAMLCSKIPGWSTGT